MSSGYLRMRGIRGFGAALLLDGAALFVANPTGRRDCAVRFALDGDRKRKAWNHRLLRQPRHSALRGADALRKVLLQDLVGLEIIGKRAHASLYA